MRLQPEACEGEIGGIDLCPDLEVTAIVGFADKPEQVHDLHQGLVLYGSAGQLAKAVPGNLLQPRTFCGGFLLDGGKLGRGNLVVELAVPELDPWCRPTALIRHRPVIGILEQPVDVEGDRLAFRRETYLKRPGLDGRLGNRIRASMSRKAISRWPLPGERVSGSAALSRSQMA